MKNFQILRVDDLLLTEFQNKSDEEQLHEVNEALETVSQVMSDIYEEQDKLYNMRNEINKRIISKKSDLFNLQEGSIIVGFAKHMDYHYVMVQAFVVRKIYTKFNKLNVLAYTYRMDDGDISYNVTAKSIGKSTIFEMTDQFYTCTLDTKTFDELKDTMSLLPLSQDDFMQWSTYF
jgi:hypothetical protein